MSKKSKEKDIREHRLFLSLDRENKGSIKVNDFKKVLQKQGLKEDDLRLKECYEGVKKCKSKEINYEQFCDIIRPNILLVERALQGNLTIPDFEDFCKEIIEVYDITEKNREGAAAGYIPELAKVNPEQFGVAICTNRGQRFSHGDAQTKFSIQSTCKTINYCLALEEHGEEYVHKHVGREPSGRRFNEVTFDDNHLPHNPMINAGAVMSTSLVKPKLTRKERLNYILGKWGELAGGVKVRNNEDVAVSESRTGYRNRALGWLMVENNAFPPATDLNETLELYFRCCSIELNAQEMSVVAATLANGGICPTNGKLIFQPKTVQNCLSLMYSCGMYDFSGEYAFSIGLPTKSGVGGGLLIVIPNLMGICTWSPRLDKLGNSCRGIEFCKHMVDRFNVHHYDNVIRISDKKNPRLSRIRSESDKVNRLIWSASKGDLGAIQRLEVRGIDLNGADYDKRTPLHLAAAEGQVKVVKYFVEKKLNLNPQDRWGNTPLDDAIFHSHQKVVDILKENKALHHGANTDRGQQDSLGQETSANVVEVIWAASEGNIFALQQMVARGININGADYDKRTPLHLAASEGHIETVKYLVNQGANVKAKDRWGATPLDDAKRHEQEEITKILKKTK